MYYNTFPNIFVLRFMCPRGMVELQDTVVVVTKVDTVLVMEQLYQGGYGTGYGAAIILVLFILLVIVIGARAWGGNNFNN